MPRGDSEQYSSVNKPAEKGEEKWYSLVAAELFVSKKSTVAKENNIETVLIKDVLRRPMAMRSLPWQRSLDIEL